MKTKTFNQKIKAQAVLSLFELEEDDGIDAIIESLTEEPANARYAFRKVEIDKDAAEHVLYSKFGVIEVYLNSFDNCSLKKISENKIALYFHQLQNYER